MISVIGFSHIFLLIAYKINTRLKAPGNTTTSVQGSFFNDLFHGKPGYYKSILLRSVSFKHFLKLGN